MVFSSKIAPNEGVESEYVDLDNQPLNQLGEGMIHDLMSSMINEKISE